MIRHNFFHHLFQPHEGGPGVQAIFLDDDTLYVATVFGNVFYRTGSTGVIKFHGGGGASIANNIAIRSPQLVQETPGGEEGIARAVEKMQTDLFGHGFPRHIEQMRIDEDPYRSRYPYLYETYAEQYNPGTPQWNNFEADDELEHFVDPANLVFAVRADSPLLDRVAENVYDRVYGLEGEDVAFEPIPFDRIGLHEDEHRTTLGPAAFDNLGPADGTSGLDANAVQLWWRPSANADRYRVTVATDRQMQNIVSRSNVQANHITLRDLEPGGDYHWQVEAVIDRSRSNRGKRSAAEQPWTFSTRP